MSVTKGLVSRESIQGIADGIRYVNGSNTEYKPAEMEAAVRALKKNFGSKTIVANGSYLASNDNLDGYSSVTVDVPTPTPNLQQKTVTENGTVTPDSGYDGLSSVVVNVPSGGSGFTHVTVLTEYFICEFESNAQGGLTE